MQRGEIMAAAAGPSDESKVKDEKVKEEKEDGEEKRDERIFECNICLDTARDAVVSMCGHLFW